MKKQKLELTELVTALASQPRLPGLTPRDRCRTDNTHRTARIIEMLLEAAHASSNLQRH